MLSGRLMQLDVGDQTAFLRSILESSTEYALIATDLDGKILSWNEGARRSYRYEADDILGRSALSLHDPDDSLSGRARAFFEEARTAGKWDGRLKRVRKDGSTFIAQVTITPRRDLRGRALGFTMISRDLTDVERVDRELRESQEYNRGLVESNIDALMTTDSLGLVTDVNRQMCQLTGVPREELIGTPFKQYFTDPQRAEDAIRKVLIEDRVTNYELTLRSRTGEQTLVSYNATTFRSSSGKLKGVFAAARDITAQKRLEEDLRRAQTYTRGLIEASVDALMTVDPQLRIMDVNEQTVRITGYSRDELIGEVFPELFTDADRASRGVIQTLGDGMVTDYVLVLRAKDGRETPVSFNASVFRDAGGRLEGILVAARDITGQQRLENELREAQNYTRGLIESSIDPMVTVDSELRVMDANEQMVQLTAVPKEMLIGSRFERYFTEPERAARGVRQALQDGFVTHHELTLRRPDGGRVVVSFNASIFRDPAGTVRGVFAVARDVTAQRHLEEQLREQQNYSRGLIEASVDALVTVDPDGNITDVNEQMVRLTGRSRGRLIGRAFADHFTDPARARAGVTQTFRDGVVTNYELAVRSSAGKPSIVSFNASVFRDTAGQVAGIVAAARDVSDQKALEAQLLAQQAYTRGLVESNIDALVTTDPLGIITDVNRQMCAVTGRTREELVGTRLPDCCTDPARAEDGIRKVLVDGRVTNFELTIRARDGKELTVSYNATTFTDAHGKLGGVFGAARDITDHKHLEAELRQAHAYNRGLIESSVDAMLTVDVDNTISDVNEQMVRLSGYTREQLIGSAFDDYFTEPERAGAGVRQTLEAGFVTNYELTLRSRLRRLILVAFNASVFRSADGRVRGIYAIARDITEQRRLEEQLRESENYNRGLIESSVDALVTVGPDLRVMDVNEQMVKLTGHARDELVGSPFRDYFTEPERAAAGIRQAFEHGTVTSYELVLRSRTGKRTVVSFNAGTFGDLTGKVAGILAAARDITAQKRLEEQLREQQTYNRNLIESSADALMVVGPDGRITDINEQTVNLTQINRKQLVGLAFQDLFTDPARARDGVRDTLERGAITNYELVVRSRRGRRHAVSLNATVFREASGEIGGILVSAREVDEQKRIEQELRDQQSYTRGLIESNIDALMTTDPIGIITDVNKQMCEVTGYTRHELIGTPFTKYVTDARRAEAGIRQVLADGRITNYELTLRGRGARQTRVSYNATTFTAADGALRGVLAAARDVTEQKRLEAQVTQRTAALTDATNFLNNILESSTEYSIIAKDLERNVLAWNEGARRTYGYTSEEMIGHGSTMLHVPEDLASGRVEAAFSAALETGKYEGELEGMRSNGQRFTAHVAITLRRDASGAPIGFVLISKDITEQKALEDQLRRKHDQLEEQNLRVQQANRMKSEFLANMSHELRTPLNGIIGFSELMHTGRLGEVSEPHREYLGDILSSARHLLQLINDVLDLSKVEAGKLSFRDEPLDLARLVAEVRDVLRTVASKKRIAVAIDVEGGLSAGLRGDPSKLKQILYNYLSNALKFTAEGGRVAIRGRAVDDEHFRLEVEDNGIGIKTSDFDRLFVEFQQLDGGMTKRYAGTGLGLALTKRLAEAQGGRVEVRSDVGVGSCFGVVLPRVLNVVEELDRVA